MSENNQENLKEGPLKDTLVKQGQPIELGPLSDYSHIKGSAQNNAKKIKQDGKPSLESILESIIPPREWAEEEKVYVQQPSVQMSSRIDVIKLKDALDQKLVERMAREGGICPIREELHAQAFDEIIRQIAIESPERGLLLTRVRDEIKMTIAAYQTLQESSVTFGTKKQIHAEQGKNELEFKLEELTNKKNKLAKKVKELTNKIKNNEDRNTKRREIDLDKKKQEKEFWTKQQQQLEAFFKTIHSDA